jgi:hypothetical protein
MRTTILGLVLSIITINATAQQVKKGFEIMELIKLAEVYKETPFLSFDFSYTYADSASPSTILEQLNGSTKISSGRYWTFLDSIEFVQGYQYNLAVYYKDSNIVVNDRQDYGDLFKLPLMDSIFRAANVDSMRLDVIAGTPTYREFTVYFDPSAPFRLYKLRYDPSNFRIQSIKYYIKDVPIETGAITTGTALVELSVSNYSSSSFDLNVFQEDKFIYKSNGELFEKPAYSSFKLFSNITTKPMKLYDK